MDEQEVEVAQHSEKMRVPGEEAELNDLGRKEALIQAEVAVAVQFCP